MATKHRRINVTCDPVLASALHRSAGRLAESSDAGRLRALALVGARALEGEDADGARRSADAEIAQLVATGKLVPASAGLPAVAEPPHGGTPGTDALDWVRGER